MLVQALCLMDDPNAVYYFCESRKQNNKKKGEIYFGFLYRLLAGCYAHRRTRVPTHTHTLILYTRRYTIYVWLKNVDIFQYPLTCPFFLFCYYFFIFFFVTSKRGKNIVTITTCHASIILRECGYRICANSQTPEQGLYNVVLTGF